MSSSLVLTSEHQSARDRFAHQKKSCSSDDRTQIKMHSQSGSFKSYKRTLTDAVMIVKWVTCWSRKPKMMISEEEVHLECNSNKWCFFHIRLANSHWKSAYHYLPCNLEKIIPSIFSIQNNHSVKKKNLSINNLLQQEEYCSFLS